MSLASLALSFSEWAESVVGVYGYLGIFLVSLVGNLTVIFPVPAFAFVFAMGAVLNPWLVGLMGGAGAALGEITGYGIGRVGSPVAMRKYGKQIKRLQKWAEKRGMFFLIMVFAATPLPSDVTGVLAGLSSYDLKKFLIANLIGKTAMNLLIAWAGFHSFEAVLQWVGG